MAVVGCFKAAARLGSADAVMPWALIETGRAADRPPRLSVLRVDVFGE